MSTENTTPTPEQSQPQSAAPQGENPPAKPQAPAPGANAPAAPPVYGPAPLPPLNSGGAPAPQGKGPPPRGGQGPGGRPGPGRGGPRGGDRPQRSDKPYNQGGPPPIIDYAANKPNNRELDKLIEDELEQAMAGFDVAAAVAQKESVQKPQPQKSASGRKTGVVVGVHGNDVFVEVPGGRSQGVLPLQQFEGRKPAVGEAVEFDIDHYDSANGLLVLTREGSAQVVHDWSQVTQGLIVEARVTGTNKNKTGLTVEVNGIKGFLPASQLDMYRVEDITQFVNQRLKVMVVEVVPSEKNLIVSRRAVQERDKQVKAEEFWKNVQEGQVKRGIVRSIKPFGAFVDLGGADGLIPASEFSWQRVNDLNEFVKLGQEVEVLINRVDFEARKIGLSMKQLTVSPFEEFGNRVKAGARVTGKVTRIAEFGAFVELEPGVEGLIHVSELSTQRVRKVRDIVSEGQTVQVEILSVDPAARRISLSLKRIAQQHEEDADAAEQAEHEAAMKAAEEAMANRPVNPNLRGGIGSQPKVEGQ